MGMDKVQLVTASIILMPIYLLALRATQPFQWRIQGWCLGCLGTTLGSKEDHRFSMKGLARQLSRHLPQAKKTSIYHHELASKCD